MPSLQQRPDGECRSADILATGNRRNPPESARAHSAWPRVTSSAGSAARPAPPTPTAIPPAPDAIGRDRTWRRLLPSVDVRPANHPATAVILRAYPDRATH